MLKLMNLRPDPVDGVDPWTGEGFHCAARPGTMEVNDRLGNNLADQGENWRIVADEQPARSAPKAAWVAYAVAQGADPDETEGMSRADLVSAYGSEENG